MQGASRSCRRQGIDSPPEPPAGMQSYQNLDFSPVNPVQISDLQHCKLTHLCSLKTGSLWYFVHSQCMEYSYVSGWLERRGKTLLKSTSSGNREPTTLLNESSQEFTASWMMGKNVKGGSVTCLQTLEGAVIFRRDQTICGVTQGKHKQ